MKKIMSAFVLFALICCSSSTAKIEPIVDGVISCAQAEATALGAQVSVVQVGLDVASALLAAVSGGDVMTAIDGLIAKYKPTLGGDAEALIACAVHTIETGGAGSAAPTIKALDPQTKLAAGVVAKRGWRFR